MSFTVKDVFALREKTGCGMMDCKKALIEADGDSEKAVDVLREKGFAAAAKKANRIAAEGIVTVVINDSLKVGVIIEINSETDFVAKNSEFIKFTQECANVVIEQNPVDVNELLKCKLGNSVVDDVLKEKILVIGENLKIRRFTRFEGVLCSYIHGGGKIGVMVKFSTTENIASSDEFKNMAKDIALQIAAINPLFLNKESVDTEVLEKEKQILMSQAINEGKPQNIAEKMVNGRISKYYKENCLLEQDFVKNSEQSVLNYISSTVSNLGGKIEIIDFVRFEKGEGLEKKESNFVDEVAKMIK